MSKATDLSRLSLRKDQVLEVHFSRLPEPPSELLRLPGFKQWWEQLVLWREREEQALHRLANNIRIATP